MKAKLDAVEDVKIDPSGRFKYILIKLYIGDHTKYIVRGFKWAEYHADIYEREESSILPPGIETECVGGGRIQHDDGDKIISVFGYSMGFGRADHSITVGLLQKKYPDYAKISYSNEGY